MNPHRFLSLLPLALFVACNDDGPTAGTNDEVTTSLQILADNVRSFPAPPSGDGAVAGRAAASEVGWSVQEMTDHGTWSAWKVRGRTPDSTIDSGFSTYATFIHSNGAGAYTEAVETYVKDQHGVRRMDYEAVVRNRSGFVWQNSQRIVLNTSGEWGHGFTRTGRLDFPTLGLHCEYSVKETGESNNLLALLFNGLPLLSGDRVVGRFAIDSTEGDMRWSDVDGRIYTARPLAFAGNAQDSFGLRIASIARTTQQGADGLRIEGRFRIPDAYGLRADSLRIYQSDDSLKFPGIPTPISSALPGETFSIFVPTGEFGSTLPAWIMTEIPVHPRQNPSIIAGNVRSPILKVR